MLEVIKRLDKGDNATQQSIEFGAGKAIIGERKKDCGKIEQFCSATSVKTLQKRQTVTLSAHLKIRV